MNIAATKLGSFSKAYRGWLIRFAIMLSLGSAGDAQSSVPAETDSDSDGISLEASVNTRDSAQNTGEDASQAAVKPGSIVGTILDQSGTVGVGAVVRLISADKSVSREAVSGSNGQFYFSNVPPGHFTTATDYNSSLHLKVP